MAVTLLFITVKDYIYLFDTLIKRHKKNRVSKNLLQASNKVTRTSIRVNLPQGSGRTYMSRAKEKTTNLALTVITVFVITNLPFMVLEFLRQGIISNYW